MQTNQEQDLIARCLQADQAACNQLYAAHAPAVRAYLLRCGFSPADADDLGQEIFLRVFKSLNTFDPSLGSFVNWLATIARNAARKRWRRRPQPDNFDPELAEEVLASGDNPSQAAAAAEQIDAVRQCVQTLPEDLARIVRLRYVQAKTTRGLADEISMAEATVRLRLKEALDLLERCLRGKGILD